MSVYVKYYYHQLLSLSSLLIYNKQHKSPKPTTYKSRYTDLTKETMAGYGNRTAPDYIAEDLQDQHTTTRLGLVDSNTAYHNPHEKHGSGTTSGAGFGTSTLHSTPMQLPSHPSLNNKQVKNLANHHGFQNRKQTRLLHPQQQHHRPRQL
jgi:hypothetical protein